VHGPAEVAGVPIAESVVEQLRANASITPVLVDDDGTVLGVGRAAPAISSATPTSPTASSSSPLAAHHPRPTGDDEWEPPRAVGVCYG
jgi:hypothetical protein